MRRIVFQRSRILLSDEGVLHSPREVSEEVRDPHGGLLRVGPEEDAPRIVIGPDDGGAPDGARFLGLRSALSLLPADQAARVGRARQLLAWREQHRFCGRCGSGTELDQDGGVLRCPHCGLQQFPRVSPAVIVLVHDGDRLLLGRAPRFPPGMYSTLAGFVEPGESAEETIHREIREESGVEVIDLRYFGSQSWPFPHSLMLGFHARYRSGEVRCHDDELEDVRWFAREALPELPPPISIARQLIEAYLGH
jgi:NAD+ diphosphatase